MNYSLNQLSIYVKICETSSITKAANDLYLTQPAVSIQLRNFQEQFDVPLTEIIGKKIHITDFGREIEKSAREILEKIQEIEFKANSYKGLLSGKLRIASVSTGKYVIPYFLTKFINKYSGIQLQLDVTNKTKVVESVDSNEVDFGFVSIIPKNLSVFNESLMENKIFLVSSKKYLDGKKIVSIEDLKNLTIIFREEGSGTRFKMERFFENNNIKINRKLELTSNEAVKQAVIAELGVSIMPLIGIKNELQNGDLQIVNLKELPLITKWNLIWNSQKSLSPVAKSFLEYLKKEKNEIINHKFDWYNEY